MFNIEYCVVIKLFCKESITLVQIKEHWDCVYGQSSHLYLTVKELAKLFKLRKENLDDVCPLESITSETSGN